MQKDSHTWDVRNQRNLNMKDRYQVLSDSQTVPRTHLVGGGSNQEQQMQRDLNTSAPAL